MQRGKRRGTQPLPQRRRGEPVKLDAKVQRVGPVVPLRAMLRRQRLNRDPRHAQRIGNDNAVHRLAEQHPAASDRGDDRGRIAARIDQFDAGRRGRFEPGATLRAVEMRHEGDRIAADRRGPSRPGAATWPDRRGHTRCRVPVGVRCGGREPSGSPSAHPARAAARSRHSRRRRPASARVARVPCIEHRSDAEEQSRPGRRPSKPGSRRGQISRFSSSPKFRASPRQ